MAVRDVRAIVVDDGGQLPGVTGLLRAHGYDVCSAVDLPGVATALAEGPAAVVVLPSGEHAAETIERVRAAQPALDCLVLVAPETLSALLGAVPPRPREIARAALVPLKDVERDHIAFVLEQSGGNISRAARILEIDRVTLYNKIRKYALRDGPERAVAGR